jgi:hypothetical protein
LDFKCQEASLSRTLALPSSGVLPPGSLLSTGGAAVSCSARSTVA